jgi:hypothetical protein
VGQPEPDFIFAGNPIPLSFNNPNALQPVHDLFPERPQTGSVISMRRSTSLRSLLSTHTSYNFGAFGVVLISICFLWINLAILTMREHEILNEFWPEAA